MDFFLGDNIDVDPRFDIIREFVILNGCEGSQNHAEQRYFALLSMTGPLGQLLYYFFILK